MTRPVIIPDGQRFGKLLVLRYIETRGRLGAYYECQCDCGMLTIANGARMRAGTKLSCGCLHREARRKSTTLDDLAGRIFGRWRVLGRAASATSSVRWLCECECGTVKAVIAQMLRSGQSTSCGCAGRGRHHQL